jgi:DNA helicase-2/ATP-dependent DNA helicase PcrA
MLMFSSRDSAPKSAVLHGLTPAQAEAATKTGAVLVLAGAGTGKTKTLTAAVAHRIAALGVPADRILAVTFTNRAAAEMAGRIRSALGDAAAPRWSGTYHGLGARQLRIEPEVAGLRPGFDILDTDDSRRIVKRVMKGLNLAAGDEGLETGRDPIKLMCNRISGFKDNLITPDEAPAHIEALIVEANRNDAPIDAPGLRATAAVYASYQRTLRDTNASDFGDLLLYPALAMLRNQTYRKRWSDRFSCILSDEFQDVNRAQFTWLRLFAADHGEIFCVGDDDQAVYGWRGADIQHIRRFTQVFPGAA